MYISLYYDIFFSFLSFLFTDSPPKMSDKTEAKVKKKTAGTKRTYSEAELDFKNNIINSKPDRPARKPRDPLKPGRKLVPIESSIEAKIELINANFTLHQQTKHTDAEGNEVIDDIGTLAQMTKIRKIMHRAAKATHKVFTDDGHYHKGIAEEVADSFQALKDRACTALILACADKEVAMTETEKKAEAAATLETEKKASLKSGKAASTKVGLA